MTEGRPIVGIALDSGGAMGGAHVGVMDVLREHDIPLDIIVGSSAGAAVGAFYATGSLDAFKGLISDLSFTEALSFYADPVFPISGLFAGERARKFLRNLVGDVLIEDLPFRYVAVATDLLSGETVPIDKGPLVDAVMASISMPGIFKPVVHMGRLLTDGGVSDPLPLDILKSLGPDITIACNLHSRMPDILNPSRKKAIVNGQKRASRHDQDLSSWVIERLEKTLGAQKVFEGMASFRNLLKRIEESPAEMIRENELISIFAEHLNQSRDKIGSFIAKSFSRKEEVDTMNIFEVMLSATNIQQFQKNRLMLLYEQPDILIEPEVTEVGSLEFTKGESTIAAGREKALEAVSRIQELLNQRGRT